MRVPFQKLVLNKSGHAQVLDRFTTIEDGLSVCVTQFTFVIIFKLKVDARALSADLSFFVHDDESAGQFIVATNFDRDASASNALKIVDDVSHDRGK